MPLVVLCGQPSSAKTTVASAIEQYLRSQGHEAILISEDTLHQERNVAYKGARAEMLQSNSAGISTYVFNALSCRLYQRKKAQRRSQGNCRQVSLKAHHRHP